MTGVFIQESEKVKLAEEIKLSAFFNVAISLMMISEEPKQKWTQKFKGQ